MSVASHSALLLTTETSFSAIALFVYCWHFGATRGMVSVPLFHLFQILKVADIRLGVRVGGIGMICVPARSKWWQLLLRRE